MSRNKYGAKRTVVDGFKFDSQAEAYRYQQLVLMQRGGVIRELEVHPPFPLEINGKPLLLRSKGFPGGRKARYEADFRYFDVSKGDYVVEDVKGADTPISQLKRAIVEAQYGIRVTIIARG